MARETVLVTGAAGFIGPQVIRRLLAEGYRAVAIDKLTYAARTTEDGRPMSLDLMMAQCETDELNGHLSFHRMDICGSAARRLLENPGFSHLINLAAESHVDRSLKGAPEFLKTEMYGTFNLLEAIKKLNGAAKGGLRSAVFVSTDEVYGSIDRHAQHEGDAWYQLSDTEVAKLIAEYMFTETTPLAGGSPYASCKGGADLLVGAYFNTFKWNQEGLCEPERMPVVTTRCVNNFGPYQHPEKLIPLAICTLLMPEVNGAKRRIPVYDRGLAVREWIHSEDHARAIVSVMKEGGFGDIYNIGSGLRCRNRDLLLAIFRACNKICGCDIFNSMAEASFDATTRSGVARPGHDLCYAVDCRKLTRNRKIGWQPKHTNDLERGIFDTVKWYYDNPDWWKPVWTSEEFSQYWNGKYEAILNGADQQFEFYTKDELQRGLNSALL